MPFEIERRFLLQDPHWRPTGKPERIVQGYFWLGETATARIAATANKAFHLVIQPADSRLSYSLPLPAKDGAALKKAFNSGWTLRVRHSSRQGGLLTLKGKAKGLSRPEYEYPLGKSDTEVLLALTSGSHVIKDRYRKPHKGFVWEIDIYHGKLSGHASCEVELANETQQPALPPFVGVEVSHQKSFTAAALARSQRPPRYPKAA